MKQSGNSGFSLVELLVALSIVVILMAIAAPGFQQLMAATSMTSQANEFVTALSFTRSEAVKRNTRVTICKSSAGTACTTTGAWQQGWIVFDDAAPGGTIGTVDASETILRVHGPLTGGSTLVGSADVGGVPGVANFVQYLSNGQSIQSGQWDLCGLVTTVAGRDIVLSAGTGRPSVIKDEPPVTCN